MTLPEATARLMASVPGFDFDIHDFPKGTKTAQDAANAIGCPLAAIVKSLVFMVVRPEGDQAVVALVPGDRRLDTEALAEASGAESARRASLAEVRSATGYAAGGTPPFGYSRPIDVYGDETLKRNDPLWAAAGTPTTVFPISLADLDRLARPIWARISL